MKFHAAALVSLTIVSPSGGGGPGASFTLPYSTGTHRGEARVITGKVSYDPVFPEKVSGSFAVPIAAIATGNDKQDCHMREALGLDYSKSEFPKEHVCDDNNKLPASGPNAVVHSEVRFEITGMGAQDDAKLVLDREKQVDLDGKWTIHGVTRPARIPVKIRPDGDGFRLTGTTKLSLKSFGVEVKSAKILFITISVDDEVTVLLDLGLKK